MGSPRPATGLPFFLGPVAEVAVGDTVTLGGDEAHHAVVRRIRAGERVGVTDGAGVLATGDVVEATRSALVVSVHSVDRTPRPEPRVTVVQAVPKGARAERAVEVLTEVGVDRIVPWAAARCVAVWRDDRAGKALERWRSTAREAAKQARRTWLPDVGEVVDVRGAAEQLAAADLGVVLHEAADRRLGGLEVPKTGSVVVVVGPEGGITDDELAHLGAAGHVVGMGETVLRTSTAGVAAVAGLLTQTSRWR